MRQLWKVLGVCAVLSVLLAQPVLAVSIANTEIPIDAQGERVVNSARQTWIPVIVILAIVSLATIIIIGAQRLAGVSVRTAIGLALLSVAATGAGLQTLFPGIVTSVILP